jgi:hypothetical protein
MIQKKIKKDNINNYFVSFTPKAQNFFLEKKIRKISNQKKFNNFFFNQNTFLENVSELNTNGFTIIKNFFDKKTIQKISQKTDQLISKGKKLDGVRDNLKELKEKKNFFERIWLPNSKIKNMSLKNLRSSTNGISISNPLVNFPELVEIFSSEKFIRLLYNFYECVPELTYIKVRKAFANKLPANDTQFFHRDSGSFRLLKAVVYLNDVDINTGPFTYTKKTNQKFDFPKKKLRFSDKEIANFYGKKNIKYLTAKRGDLVLANTTGFHKGLKPKLKDRNICIANFCLHDEVGFTYNKITIKKKTFEKLKPIQKLLFKNLKII